MSNFIFRECRPRPLASSQSRVARCGLTLVEVLVVISIIGVLIGLLLPAVQMARESSRRTACANNLRQLGLAAKLHVDGHGTFPTGGWGSEWVGDPDAGFGPKQPGGWIYNILPYIEQQSLRDLGKGLRGPVKEAALIQLLETPLAVTHCPSRREPVTYPYTGPSRLQQVTPPQHVAKSDFSVNTLVSSKKSEVIVAEIQLQKGTSNTPLAGEKSLSPEHYLDGQGEGDKLTMYAGDCIDVGRAADGQASPDASAGAGFGTANPGVCQFVYCDGSVRAVSYDEGINP